ncbi:MAG: molecular chaperone HtpG [Chlamydiota bacterium]
MKGKLKVHSENILPIIKKWLYSDKDIFLRELVANASDAMVKRALLEKQEGKPPLSPRMDITIDREKKTLTIADTGIGMDAEEVEKYIAQVAFSGAKEFAEKYAKDDENAQVIGHFGLGFFSAFMVASRVELLTLSYKEGSSAALWTSDGSSDYELTSAEKEAVGTTITLHLAEDSLEYLEEKKVLELLKKHCSYLSYPIYVQGTKINHQEPTFLKRPQDCSDEDYQTFYRHLYPQDPSPLFWIHIHIDFPFHVQGILYFPKIHKGFDFQSNQVQLYCNRVFVADSCKDLLPDYLMILKGAIDSPDIPLNVSRSYLQMDKTVRSLGQHIAKKITQKLRQMHTEKKEEFLAVWPEIEMVIKLGILQDSSLYDKVKDFLVWKTLKGAWISIEDLKARGKTTVHYTTKDTQDLGISSLYQEKDIDVLLVNPIIDNPLLQRLEEKLEIKFQRIDAHLDDSFLDQSREKTLLDESGRSGSALIAEFIQESLDQKELTVEAKSLASEKIPALLVIDEQNRRLKEFMATHARGQNGMDIPQKKTFIVNTNHPVVNKAFALKKTQPDLAKALVTHIYDLTRLSQKELSASDLSHLVSRSQNMVEELVNLLP